MNSLTSFYSHNLRKNQNSLDASDEKFQFFKRLSNNFSKLVAKIVQLIKRSLFPSTSLPNKNLTNIYQKPKSGQLTRLRMVLGGGTFVFLLILWVAISQLLSRSYQFEKQQATNNIIHLDHSFGSAAFRLISEIDSNLINFSRSTAEGGGRNHWLLRYLSYRDPSPMLYNSIMSSNGMKNEIVTNDDSNEFMVHDNVLDYSYINSKGNTVDTPYWHKSDSRDQSNSISLKPTGFARDNWSNFDFFENLINAENNSLYISKPWRNKTDGRWLVTLARRVQSPSGEFGGVVAATIDPYYFSRLFRTMDVGGQGSLAIVGSDGVIRLQLDHTIERFGNDISQSSLFNYMTSANLVNAKIVHSEQMPHTNGLQIAKSTWQGTDPVSGAMRTFSFVRTDHIPLWVVIGMSETDIMTRYHEARNLYLWFGIGISLLIIILAELMAKLIYRQIKLSNQLLAATLSKTEFLSNMSHELRTPMNGIIGIIDIVKDSPLTTEQSHLISLIDRSSKGLLVVIDDILEVSNLQAERVGVAIEEFALKDLIASLTEVFQPEANRKNLLLETHIMPQVPELIKLDQQRLRQVLMNLIGNAIKFTPEGKISLTIGIGRVNRNDWQNSMEAIANDSTMPPSKAGSEKLWFQLCDSGIGIPDQIKVSIFEKFVQADNSAKRTYGGSGLGLSITRQLIELMGGQIGVVDAEGGGSIFRFWLPLKMGTKVANKNLAKPLLRQDMQLGQAAHLSPENNPLRTEFETPSSHSLQSTVKSVPANASSFIEEETLNASDNSPTVLESVTPIDPNSQTRILLVEDNRINQTVAVTMLTRLGNRVEIANNGKEALELIAKQKFDLVLMDLQMPIMDGEEATRLIRQDPNYSNLPIIALTAHSVSGIRERAIALGFDDCLSKPLQREQFAELVLQWRNGRNKSFRLAG